MKRGRRGRSFSPRFRRGSAEYLWAAGYSNSTLGTATQTQVVVAQDADFERGTTGGRETCTIVRTLVELQAFAGDVGSIVTDVLTGLIVLDEAATSPVMSAYATSDDSRWLRAEPLPAVNLFSDGTAFGTTFRLSWDIRQKVKFSNDQELRFLVQNLNATTPVDFVVFTRCLLMLSH